MNYYNHHIGDYAKDTAHLTMLEDAAYRRMLDLYYSSERALPLNRDGLYRLVRARSKDEKKAVDTILEEFFHLGETGWHQTRCDEEIAKTKDKSQSAKHSASKRWQCERNANASQTHMPTQSEGNAPNNQEPITNNQEKKPARKRAAQLPDDFGISDRVKAWADKSGFSNLDRYLEFFTGRMRANGKTYADWDQALMNAVRDDWAKIGDGKRKVAI